MSVYSRPTDPASAERLAPPQLRPARFEDHPRIHRLESEHLPESLAEQDWCGLFTGNPLWPRLKDRWPIGWVLESSNGELVGSVTNIPAGYRFRGAELLCANGRGWVVAPDYRGYALLLMDEYYRQEGAHLFLNTTVDQDAAWASDLYCSRVPRGDYQSLAFRITSYRDFARTALEMKGVPVPGLLHRPAAGVLWLKDALLARLPAARPAIDVAEADDFDERFDAFWTELVRQRPDTLLAVRDRAALAWHYAIPLRRQELWIVTASRGGRLLAYCVVKRHHRTAGIRSMRLIDFQSVEQEYDLLPDLLRAVLRRCAAERVHVLEHLGCGLPATREFDRLAPYRVAHNWPFFFHTDDPRLAAELADPEVWDPSEFDGDATYV
jgi:hypothetical protein